MSPVLFLLIVGNYEAGVNTNDVLFSENWLVG
jgi:hypothetical protein